MNYEERKRLIAQWINPESGFLRDFKPPQVADLAGELVGLVETINEESPILPNAGAFQEYLARLGREVSKKAKTRSWPMQSAFVAAIADVRARPVPAIGGYTGQESADPTLDRKVELAAEWFGKFGQLPGWWNTGPVCEGLIKRGHCTYEELKAAHASVPLRKDAAHLGAQTEEVLSRFSGNR